MRYALALLLSWLLISDVSAQNAADLVNEDLALYSLRKYSFSLAVSPYINVTHGGGNYLFGATEVTFSDRFKWLSSAKNAIGEANMGVAFEPFQGTKLNLGLDYLLLHKNHRANLYGGMQFSQGLTQATNTEGNAYIKVGLHSYIMPFAGLVWWPWKANEKGKGSSIWNPHIAQLFYIKLQVGYSVLLNNRVKVDTTGGFTDAHLYQVIRNNTASTLAFRICIGIDIPTISDWEKKKYATATPVE
jgi:hypothetical protein